MTPHADSAAAAAGPGGPEDRLLPWGRVRDITGLSRTTAWRRQKAGDFPLAVQISPGRVGWWESELTAWKASRTPRRSAPPPVLLPPAPAAKPETPPARGLHAPAQESRAKPGAAAAPSKRRRRPGCEGQIAFDF